MKVQTPIPRTSDCRCICRGCCTYGAVWRREPTANTKHPERYIFAARLQTRARAFALAWIAKNDGADGVGCNIQGSNLLSRLLPSPPPPSAARAYPTAAGYTLSPFRRNCLCRLGMVCINNDVAKASKPRCRQVFKGGLSLVFRLQF